MISKCFKKQLDIQDFAPDYRNNIRDYICTLCKGIYMRPTLCPCPCGHVFCKECIFRSLDISPICPVSNEPINRSQLQYIEVIQQTIDQNTVYCSNRMKGCTWLGKYGSLEFHTMNVCLKEVISCPNHGCSLTFKREELYEHNLICDFRMIKCDKCNDDVIFILRAEHVKVCLKEMIECTQLCGLAIERGKLEVHLKIDCENAVVDCTFAHLGCPLKIFKKDLKMHLDSSSALHNGLLLKSVLDFKSDVFGKLDAIKNLQSSLETRLLCLDMNVKKKRVSAKRPAKRPKKRSQNNKAPSKKFPVGKYFDSPMSAETPIKLTRGMTKYLQNNNIEGEFFYDDAQITLGNRRKRNARKTQALPLSEVSESTLIDTEKSEQRYLGNNSIIDLN
jgi:hypothetical protein